MKRKSYLLVVIIGIAIILSSCNLKQKSEKNIIKDLSKLKTYEAKLNVTFNNFREEREENWTQIYSKDLGYIIKLGEDRTYFYKDDNIYVTDNIANKKYVLEKEFDELYKYTVVEEVLKLLNNPDSKISCKNIEGKNYTIVELVIPGSNRNLVRGEVIIDNSTAKLDKFTIYDLKGDERVKILYTEFLKNKEVDKYLFQE
ncbi:germination lipoprotein GerS-related protein [Clostridium hydrogeniformans]|uniref:germination lipoprotein GerS-related protein n=1 Tax=Clostridium hydrogeniformans TaxID=349933 RepID=UPI000484A7C6|nr:germination lipoprotein GerS-related protein [Clostridium hydrogeniformans]